MRRRSGHDEEVLNERAARSSNVASAALAVNEAAGIEHAPA
jgi:hypothetical protein